MMDSNHKNDSIMEGTMRVYNKIICPYCFAEFNHDDVLFRAETCFNDDDILEEYDIDMMEDGPEKEKARRDNDLKREFQTGIHPKYEEYWRRYGGTTEQTRKRNTTGSMSQFVENYQKPIISPKNPRVVKFDNDNGSGVRLDGDGFLSSVTDVFDGHTSSRVCPECFNPLPRNYGKYPVKFISVIGITGAGKTVYLSSLLDNMYEYADKLGMNPINNDSVNFFIEQNKIQRDIVLPQGTLPERMSQPLCYHLHYFHQGKGESETSTFVIYDIAGENCVDDKSVENFGQFILHSDGIIVLQDPKQFKKIYGEAHTMANSVLRTINNLFVGTDYCSIPIALCISKCDRLIDDGMFDGKLVEMLNEPVKSAENFKGFCAVDYNKISKAIDDFYRSQDNPTRTALRTSFDCFNYFAVSSLNCRLIESGETSDISQEKILMPAETPRPMRIEEPLFWLFKQFGFINSDVDIQDHAIVGKIAKLNEQKELWEKELSEAQSRRFGRRKRVQECEDNLNSISKQIQELMNS